MEAIEPGWVSSPEPLIDRLENSHTWFHGETHIVACSTCTTAYHIALLSATAATGDEVLCPDLIFMPLIKKVTLAGAKPGLVDVEPDSFNIAPGELEEIDVRYDCKLFGAIGDMRTIEVALGGRQKREMARKEKNRGDLRKSLLTARNFSAGTVLAAGDKVVKHSSGGGLSAGQYCSALGKRLMRTLNLGQSISIDAFDGV